MSHYGHFHDKQLWPVQVFPILIMGLIYIIIKINNHYASKKEYNREWQAVITHKGVNERNTHFVIIKHLSGEIHHEVYPQFENPSIFNSIQLNDTLYKPLRSDSVYWKRKNGELFNLSILHKAK